MDTGNFKRNAEDPFLIITRRKRVKFEACEFLANFHLCSLVHLKRAVRLAISCDTMGQENHGHRAGLLIKPGFELAGNTK